MKKIVNKAENIEPEKEFFAEKPYINIRVDYKLIIEIKNYINSLKKNGDFRFLNQSDFIRKALKAYQSGMELSYVETISKRKVAFTVVLEKELYNFYKQLPNWNKYRIVENCIGSYFKEVTT